MSQPFDRRSSGRPQRRSDGPGGGPADRGPRRASSGGPAPNRSFIRPGGRPARPGGPRPDQGRNRDVGRYGSDGPSEGREGRPSVERRAYAPRDSQRFEPRGDRPVYGRRESEGPPFQGRSPQGPPPPGRPVPARSLQGRPVERGPRRTDSRPPFQGRRTVDRPGADRFGARLPAGQRRSPFPMPSQRRGEPELTASASDREDTGAFAAAAPSDLIWGRHSAQAVLEGGRPIHRIWCTPEMRFSARFLQLLREAKASGVLVEEVTWARLGQISGGAVHQGIVLQPAAAETLDLGTLIEGCAAIGEAPLLLAVDGLTDPQNLGAIVRSAEALGAHGMVLPQRRNAGLTGSVAKVAAGALEHLPIARVVNLNRSLDTLKQEGYRVIGLAGDGTVSLEEANLEGPLVVVTGSEGDGLSLLTRRTCDQLVRIPLRGATPSLNASVATALLLYEVARRSWMKGLGGSAPAPRLVRPALPSPPLPPSSQEGPELGGDPGPFESESIDDSAEIAPLAEAPRSEAPLELERIALDQPAADSNPGSADPLQDHAGSLQDHAEPLQEPGDGPGKSEPVEPFTQSAAGAEEATAIPGAGYPAERSGGGAADAPTVATAGAPTSFPTGAPDPATAAQPWQASLSPTTQPASAPAPEPQFDADILL